jgi:hypothetical protein
MDINTINENNYNKGELRENSNQTNKQYNTIPVNHQKNEQNIDDNIFHKKKI